MNYCSKTIHLFLFFALVFLLSLVAATPLMAQQWTVGFLTGSGGLGDESFNDMTFKGLGQAKHDLGLNIEVREWEPSLSMDDLIADLLSTKPSLIVLNGEQFQPIIEKYAPQFPQTFFIANDFDAGHFANVKSIVYSQHEGSFLAGALAGCTSKTGKIAFLGAIDIDVIGAFRTGFIEGVNYVNDNTEIFVEYISPYPDYSGFNNPKKALEMASDLYDRGVDVIFAVAGSSGNGIIQAAKIKKKYVIGVDSNQDHMAKGYVLTSVMKRLDTAIYTETIKAFNDTIEPGTVWYGLANGGISLTPMEYSKNIVPQKVRNKLQELEKRIISGEITVTNSLMKNN